MQIYALCKWQVSAHSHSNHARRRKKMLRCLADVEADDHHHDDSAARLGPVKALRFASPLRGLTALTGPQASRVGLLRDGRDVVIVTPAATLR